MPVSQVLLRPAAAADLEDGFHWYEQQQPGLGEEFLAEIQATLDTIGESPLQFPVVHRDTSKKSARPPVSVRRLLSARG